MKKIVLVLVSILVVVQSAAQAQASEVASVLGSWSVDISRLPQPPQARPKSVTITFSSEGSTHVRTRVAVVDPTGTPLIAEGVTPLDGTPTQVKSNFEADVSATYMPRPEILIMQLAKNGNPASTRIYTVVPERNQMIETVAYFDSEGRPTLRRNYFTRLP